jgi:long-chain acyl-CoA synthetase
LCQTAFERISKTVKRPINLDDHLELDLGLDSLARIDLFFELQKLSGFEMDDKTFSDVFTVRDVLNKLKTVSSCTLKKEDSINWGKILCAAFNHEVTAKIAIKQTFLAKSANLLLCLPLQLILQSLFLLKVKGRENIPKSGPVIFCPNHASYLDAPLLAAAIGMPALLRVYFLGYSEYLDHFSLAWAKKLFRLISIDPSSKLADTLKACSFVLRNSKALCVFPEGARSVDGEIKEFKRGVGILVKELNVPVIPVSIRGSYNAWPTHKTLPKPAKVKIIFGKKMSLEDLIADKVDSIDIYQSIADTLRQEVIKLQ